MFLFTLFWEIHDSHHQEMLYGKIGVTFVYNFGLRSFYFRGQWSATLQNRGQSKKTQGQTALKNGGGSLAVGSSRVLPESSLCFV